MSFSPKKLLIVYGRFPNIAADLSQAFQEIGVETNIFYTTEYEQSFHQRVVRFLNRWARNLRVVKKGADIFKNTRFGLDNYLTAHFQKAYFHYKPDAILVIHGRPIAEDFLATLMIPKIAWWTEPHNKVEELLKIAKPFDIYNSFSDQSIQILKAHGYDARYLSHAVNPKSFYKKKSPKRFDIVFVGNWSPWRDTVLQAVLAVTSNIALYGPCWKKKSIIPKEKFDLIYKGEKIEGEALNDLFNASWIVLNASRDKGSSGLNMRFFEVLASGQLFLTDHVPELSKYFIKNQHVVVYENTAELKAKITDFLENKPLLASIAEAGQHHVIQHYQYRQMAAFFMKQFSNYDRS